MTKTIGSIAGLPIAISKFDERANLIIRGKNEYKANVSDSPTGTIASVEHALDSMEDRLKERETDLQQDRQQSDDLTRQLGQPFEHEENLAAAAKRQQEIVTALDLTKNQASALAADLPGESESTAQALEEKVTSNDFREQRSSRRMSV